MAKRGAGVTTIKVKSATATRCIKRSRRRIPQWPARALSSNTDADKSDADGERPRRHVGDQVQVDFHPAAGGSGDHDPRDRPVAVLRDPAPSFTDDADPGVGGDDLLGQTRDRDPDRGRSGRLGWVHRRHR